MLSPRLAASFPLPFPLCVCACVLDCRSAESGHQMPVVIIILLCFIYLVPTSTLCQITDSVHTVSHASSLTSYCSGSIWHSPNSFSVPVENLSLTLVLSPVLLPHLPSSAAQHTLPGSPWNFSCHALPQLLPDSSQHPLCPAWSSLYPILSSWVLAPCPSLCSSLPAINYLSNFVPALVSHNTSTHTTI